MIAKIFKAHGFHLGDDRFVNPYGYRTYENLHIRRHINRMSTSYSGLDKRLNSNYSSKHVQEIFRTNMKRSPWCIKVGPQYFQIINDAFPGIQCVLVLRDTENIIKSQYAKRGGHDVREYVEMYVDGINDLHQQHGFPIIQSDEVIAGEYASIKTAMDYCGVSFDPDTAENCIDRGRWHYARNMCEVG